MVSLNTQLHEAADAGQTDLCLTLLKKGALVNAQDEHGWSTLHWATDGGHTEVVQLLLQHGAQVNTQDKYDWSPLHMAAWKGYAEVCRLLLQHGALINTQDKHGYNALHRAAWQGYTEVCLVLLDAGADSHAKNTKQQTVLDLAIENNKGDCASAIRAWISSQAARAALQEIAVADIMKVIAP